MRLVAVRGAPPGSRASADVETTPGASCAYALYLPGRPAVSPASPYFADARGRVTLEIPLGRDYPVGAWRLVVSCGVPVEDGLEPVGSAETLLPVG